MVIKTFECPMCGNIVELEKEMNDVSKPYCEHCESKMERVFNMQVSRPSGDNKGFYGVGK